MATLFPFPSSKSQDRAMNSANWAEVPGGKGLASVISKLETTTYLALLFPSKTKLLPSVYQISSGLVRGSSDNPFWGFVQWSKVSRQELKGREPSGVGRRLLLKIVCSQKSVLKHLLSGLQELQDFKGRDRFLPNKGVGHSGTTKNWWENICPS